MTFARIRQRIALTVCYFFGHDWGEIEEVPGEIIPGSARFRTCRRCGKRVCIGMGPVHPMCVPVCRVWD